MEYVGGTARWRWAAASVAGKAHVAHGVPCQDRFGAKVVPDRRGRPTLVVVASDGAGSAANAEAGAEAVVAALMAGAEARVALVGAAGVEREDVEAWIEEARFSLDLEAGPRSSFAATLCLAVVGPDAAAFAQIGDGAVAVRGADGSWSLPVEPHHGPEASVTTFFTDFDWQANLRFAPGPPPRAVAVMTDGVESLLVRMSDMSVHRPAADGLMAPVAASAADGADKALSEGLASWMRSPAVVARTHDDLTLVLACVR